MKTGKRGFQKLGVDKAESPWRELEDRQADRATEAPTKELNKHKRARQRGSALY